ncbi:serine carboxypeptidase-like 17 isoform X1 [Daucus carota subsp. sativus]|uniref:serine carboxypeptidase-like 17 isoform X1 n=1 Tax=Daucus carota subsp. sativus TaxID=79200 RepID=UPI0007EFBE3D|nr:PREDICTED: serine carboxypeptidase-like 17 isoform X1 [Daucus carota subsp. sativus]
MINCSMAATFGIVLFISWVNLLLLLLLSYSVHSRTIIENLPGFDGPLPFKLETGYTGIGERDDIQIFYYFVESERNPREDPVVIWIPGGPGCSTLRTFFYQHGPLKFNYMKSTGKKMMLELNPYSWTKVSNVLYLDTPVGAGFSYARTSNALKSSDTISSKHVYDFLRKWFNDHPGFMSNPVYIGGVSYSGIVVPIITQEIYNGNEAGNKPEINIKGYFLGNPLTDRDIDSNSKIPYAYEVALLSRQLYESAREHCSGDYMNPMNALCARDLDRVEECLKYIYEHHILEPICESSEDEASSPLVLYSLPQPRCREETYNYNIIWANEKDVQRALGVREEETYNYNIIWANEKDVQRALGVREGTVKEWEQCDGDHYLFGKNDTDTYSYNVASSIAYHRNLTNKNCRALIYSGDHDLVFPHIGTEKWIHSLNLTVESEWAPWFVEQQVAGYETTYSDNNYSLAFATVKGAGHNAPEFKPKECLAMVDRWFSGNSLKWL